MEPLSEQSMQCPYCGESIVVLIDIENREQTYIEDCQVCCRPITIVLTLGFNGELSVATYTENETY